MLSTSFVEHINSIVAKAHLRANQILRCFLSRDPFILIEAFNVYVWPLVEYCSPVWSPTAIGSIKKSNPSKDGLRSESKVYLTFLMANACLY